MSPPPTESFLLRYDTDRQLDVMRGLCRSVGADVWQRIAADQDVAVEQVVGGNGGKGSWRLSCRKVVSGATN